MRFTQLLLTFWLSLLLAPCFAAVDGNQLYQRYCAACHGKTGNGGVGLPLRLPSFLEIVPQDYLVKTIRSGRPGRVMPAFSQLSDAQVLAIANHIMGWNKSKKIDLPTETVKGDARNGAKLFKQHCSNCHGVNGEGGNGTGKTFSRLKDLPITPPALLNKGFLGAASDQFIKMTLMKGRIGTPMISFLQNGLKEQEINDIVVYVRNFEKLLDYLPSMQSENLSPILSYTSTSSFEVTVENIKQAIINANFQLIRVQNIDNGLVDPGKEDKRKTVIYFCNFSIINELLKIDPRVGMFLPCRVTVVEKDGKVSILSVNPKIITTRFNNDELAKICDLMYEMYRSILEDSVL